MNDKTSLKIHPHKFTMWISLASIIMLFGGLSSAYLVKSYQANWLHIELPSLFYWSTMVIVLSSITLFLTKHAFVIKKQHRFNFTFLSTILLGTLFAILQLLAFWQLKNQGIRLNGNVAGSFIYLIAITHLLHIVGGLVALIIIKSRYNKNYQSLTVTPLEIISIYWHFVDILWIYLILFFTLAG